MTNQTFQCPDWSCGVGDVIESTLSDGKVLRCELSTHEAAAFGSELVLSGRWKKAERKERDETKE